MEELCQSGSRGSERWFVLMLMVRWGLLLDQGSDGYILEARLLEVCDGTICGDIRFRMAVLVRS